MQWVRFVWLTVCMSWHLVLWCCVLVYYCRPPHSVNPTCPSLLFCHDIKFYETYLCVVCEWISTKSYRLYTFTHLLIMYCLINHPPPAAPPAPRVRTNFYLSCLLSIFRIEKYNPQSPSSLQMEIPLSWRIMLMLSAPTPLVFCAPPPAYIHT